MHRVSNNVPPSSCDAHPAAGPTTSLHSGLPPSFEYQQGRSQPGLG